MHGIFDLAFLAKTQLRVFTEDVTNAIWSHFQILGESKKRNAFFGPLKGNLEAGIQTVNCANGLHGSPEWFLNDVNSQRHSPIGKHPEGPKIPCALIADRQCPTFNLFFEFERMEWHRYLRGIFYNL